ncbi:MAG: hypothetical protein K0Q71_2907 [Thermomicrobiales bacterium]|nr:hypothetical protein [Thermomicrobiales bacterium]
MPLPCRPFLASATNPGVVVRLDIAEADSPVTPTLHHPPPS